MLNSKSRLIILIVILLLFITSITINAGNIIDYPVVIYSGQPSGVLAAVSAARKGIKPLLILKRENPGGLMTYGGLNYLDLNFDKNGNNINKGLFLEWYERMGSKQSFSYQKITDVFNEMIKESKIDIFKNASIININSENNKVIWIELKDKNNKKIKIKSDYFIDASQDADLAYLAGANFFNFASDINLPDRHMASTLILNVNNIDLNSLKEDIKSNKFGPSYIKGNLIYGFKELGNMYIPKNDHLKLRGLNIILHENSNGLYHGSINALLIFKHNPLIKNENIKAYKIAKLESEYILNFLKEKLSGFKKVELKEPASELYIRESRHLVAKNILKIEDLLENKIHDNTITLGSYPLDYQASQKEYNGFVLFNPELYGIPFDSLIPDNLNNLLVVSRSTGMSSLAAASGRTLPIRMNNGTAAGMAAVLAYENNIDFISLNENNELIKKIQDYIGIDIVKLKNENVQPLIKKDMYYPYLKEMFNLGLIIGGYNNNFKLDSTITEYEFAQLIIKGMNRRNSPILYEWVPGGLESISTLKKLDKNNAYKFILAAASIQYKKIKQEDYYIHLLEKKLIPNNFEDIVNHNRELTRKEAYYLIGYFLLKYELSENLKKYRGIKN